MRGRPGVESEERDQARGLVSKGWRREVLMEGLGIGEACWTALVLQGPSLWDQKAGVLERRVCVHPPFPAAGTGGRKRS